ncbi:MAG: SIR2 family protein [Parafilimonas sp.]
MDVATAEPKKLEDWDDIINSIQEEKCILFVGPESVMKSQGVPYHQELVKSPGFQNNDYFKYIPRDEMFLLSQNFYRGKLVSRFKNYCAQNAFYDDTYKKIAAIPFHTIIAVTRYPFLVESFKNNNINFQHRWFSKIFDKSKTEEDIDAPSGELPLVYNLFGKFDIDESLLLTHNDLFDYLTKLLSDNAIPTKLKEIVKSSNEIIFLGFKFERWYVQLLLRLFELHDLNAQFERISLISGDDEDILSICETDFKMNFIEDNIDSFVSTLYDKCSAAGLHLRISPVAAGVSPELNEFNTLLKNNLFDEALTRLQTFEITNKLDDKVTQLTGNWNSIKQNKIAGVYSADDIILETNKFRQQMQAAIEDDMDQIK